jgi:hypothetical protein
VLEEESEDTKRVIRSRKSNKNKERQYNGQNEKESKVKQ